MSSIPLVGLLIWSAYLLGLALYRLYWSPIAKVPGPRLAVLTAWYEVYYDLVRPVRFPWKIKALYEKYGYVVRITSWEVHISDPAFSSIHFSTSVKKDKYAPHQDHFGIPQSTFSTIHHDLHRLRRGAMAKYFSKKNILALEPMVKKKVDMCCTRLRGFRESKEAVNLRLLFSCFTTDVVTQYTFAKSFDFLSEPDLNRKWRETFNVATKQSHWLKHFPWIWKFIRGTSEAWITHLAPDFGLTYDFEQVCRMQAASAIDEYHPGQTKTDHTTIFHELLESDLPPSEKTKTRLWQDGESLVAAGTETTSNTLCFLIVSLLVRPDKYARLKAELRTLGSQSSLQRLEQLPYLTAVIWEALRLALGISHRFIRVTSGQQVEYNGFVFPPGTPISMSTIVQHTNPELFQDPSAFEPDRWLDGKASKEDILTFSKGTRQCLGIK